MNALNFSMILRFLLTDISLSFCTQFCRWISTASDLKELDIDDNLIGDLGGREILGGLQNRKEGRFAFKITSCMPDTAVGTLK